MQISKRHQLGLIALLCFLIAGALFLAPRGANSSVAIGGSLRLGFAFGVVWLALPNLLAIVQRAPKWYWYLFLFGLIFAALRPYPFAFIIPPILLVLWIIAPKVKKYTENARRSKG